MKKRFIRMISVVLVVLLISGVAPVQILSEIHWPVSQGSGPAWLNTGLHMVGDFFDGIVSFLSSMRLTVNALSESGNCGYNGDNVQFTFDADSGVLTITGEGKMCQYRYSPFHASREILYVVIEEGVTDIGSNMFKYCTNLIQVDAPYVSTISSDAFNECTSLVTINCQSTTYLGREAFYGCSSLQNVNSELISTIGSKVFYECTSLESITLSEPMTTISSEAFSSCSNLTNVTIPDTVTKICEKAFYRCLNLQNAHIPSSLITLGDWAFFHCDKAFTELIFPPSIRSIGRNCFDYCTTVEKLVIPVDNTGFNVSNFPNLKELVVPSGFTCYSVESLTVLATENHPSECFVTISDTGKKTLKSVVIEDGFESIGDDFFDGCTNLESVVLPDSITTVGSNAFGSCNSLVDFSWPSNLTHIGEYAFSGCYNIDAGDLPPSVTHIGYRAFYYGPRMNLRITSTFEEIADHAFEGCNIQNLFVAKDYKPLPRYALSYLPVTNETPSLEYCTELKSIEIPESVQRLGSFRGCEKLGTIINHSDSMLAINAEGFEFTAFYLDPSNWDNNVLYLDRYAIRCWNDGNDPNVFRPDTICIADYCFATHPREKIVIPDRVKVIGQYAADPQNIIGAETRRGRIYDGDSISGINYVDLGKSVEIIGPWAFANNRYLYKIWMPKTVKKMYDYAFSSRNITDIYYEGSPADWLKIDQNVFDSDWVGGRFYLLQPNESVIGNDEEYINLHFYYRKDIEKVEIISLPIKTKYYVGDTDLDLTGLKIKITYADGSFKIISKDLEYLFYKNNWKEIGDADMIKQRVSSVEFGDKKGCGFEIEQYNLRPVSFEFVSLPNKLDYCLEDRIDLTGAKMQISYNDGRTETITRGFDCSVDYFTKIGTQTVTISYKGMSASFEVNVEVGDEHEHYFDSEVVSPATCAQEGTMRYYCFCGFEYEEPIAKAEHDYQIVIVPCTCTQGGYTSHICSVCEDEYCTDETDPLGHAFGDWSIVVAPTTTQEGYRTRQCSRCAEMQEETMDRLPIILGDADGDGDIGLKDVAQITRYLASGWDVTVDIAAADVNKDGVVNLKDAVILRRYLAGGWGVEFK